MAKKKYSIPEVLPAQLNKDAWTMMVASRKELGNPYTPQGATMAINKLCKYSHEIQQKAVDRSIEGGWTGVFPESEKADTQIALAAPDTRGFIERHADSSWAAEL